MKTITVAIFSLLFSVGAFAESNPGMQPPTAPPTTHEVVPLGDASTTRPADNPTKEPSAESVDKQISPPATPSQQQAVPPPGPQKFEEPLIKLTQALTKFVEKKSEPENAPTKVVDFLSKLGVLITTILGGYISYVGFRKIPWFKEYQALIATVLTAISLLVLFYLLSGLVTSAVYVLVAIIILLIALVLAIAHLVKFIDEKYPDVRDNILAHFSQSSTSRSAQTLVRDNVRNMFDWLSNIVFVQRVNGDVKLTLDGSFVDGFDTSVFEIEADDRVLSHWEIVNDSMLIPVKINLCVIDSTTGTEAQVVNIQLGLVVVRLDNELQFKAFSNDGFQLLGAALLEQQADKMRQLLENQQRLAANTTLFNSQSF